MSEYSFHLPKPDQRQAKFFDAVLHWLFTIPDRVARFFCNDDVYQEPLDGHGISYFGELIGLYDNLGKDRRIHEVAEQAIREIRDRSKESDQIQQQLSAFGPKDSKNPERLLLEQKLKRSQLTWDDLMRFESALLQVFPEKQLRRRALSIRDEFHEVAGEDAWKKYLENKPPELTGDIDVLRADTEALLSELHWLYVSEPVQECQRARLLFTVLCGMFYMLMALVIVLAIIIIGNLGWCFINNQPLVPMMQFPLIVGVMFAGALGGSFSSLLRLQRTSMSGNAVVNLWKLDSMGVSAILSPFVGALSAILLLFLFTGHFIEGQLFPRVSFVNNCELCAVCSTNVAQTTSLSNNIPSMADMPLLASSLTLTNPQEILNKTNTTDSATNNPTSPKPEIVSANGKKQLESPWPYHFCIPFGFELAKLLIWCFIAGFSERLVPDIIDRLGEKAKN